MIKINLEILFMMFLIDSNQLKIFYIITYYFYDGLSIGKT